MRPTEVQITRPDQVLFPGPSAKEGITKGDLVDYYRQAANTMLPHLRGRPINTQRFPRGIDQQGFVQQDFADTLPDWMTRARVAKDNGSVTHPVAERREALVWLANQNCITLHTWQSRKDRLHNPDRLVFDLDPSDRSDAHDVAEVVAADDAAHRTLEIRKDKRGGRMYLEVMGNAYAQTSVAPYSVRARLGAPVATPLEWDELGERGMRADRFTIRNISKRLAGQSDPWADISRHARSLTAALQRMAKLRA